MSNSGLGTGRKVGVTGEAGFSYSKCGRREARCLLFCPMLTSTRSPSGVCVCVFTYACLH